MLREGLRALSEGLLSNSPLFGRNSDETSKLSLDAPEPPPGPLGLADRLEKLAALHERGVLTDAEFAKAKALQLGL